VHNAQKQIVEIVIFVNFKGRFTSRRLVLYYL